MNIFYHELKAHRKSLSIWLVVMIVFVWTAMIKYDAIKEGGVSVGKLMETIPQTLQAVFGMSGLDIMTVSGYIGVCYIFIAVMVAIFAGMLGAGVIAEEETDRTVEFLYPKPVSRPKILVQKGLVVVIGIALMTVALYGSLIGATLKYSLDTATQTTLLHFTLGALCLMLLSASLGFLFAAVMKQSKKGVNLVALVVVVSYFSYALSKMSTTFDWLKYISIFRWFDAKDIVTSSHVELWPVIVTLAVSILATGIATMTYRKRDLTI